MEPIIAIEHRGQISVSASETHVGITQVSDPNSAAVQHGDSDALIHFPIADIPQLIEALQRVYDSSKAQK